MKKLLPAIIALFATTLAFSQSVNDVVSLGSGYANQVWYSLENDEQGSSPKNNWDLAFGVSPQGSTIRTNFSTGVTLWVYPNGDTADWATVDTSGISSWTSLDNSETSWYYGAFDMSADPNDDFDLGWGYYDLITHYVWGDSVYVIKLGNGEYQKFWLERLASGTYYFRHATLDNNMDMSHSLAKADFSGKNFGYYSLQNHNSVDREPATNTWDLTFTQYGSVIPGFGAYNVTGVLHNVGVESVKVYPVNDVSSFIDHSSQTFSEDINTIGYDWKSFNNTTFQYDIEDSTVYFVQDLDSNIWKIVFTDFGGSATGDFEFTKEKVYSIVGIEENEKDAFFSVYPNPATDNVNVVLNAEGATQVSLFNMNGQIVRNTTLQGSGLRTEQIDLSGLGKGLYILQLNGENWSKTEKLSVR